MCQPANHHSFQFMEQNHGFRFGYQDRERRDLLVPVVALAAVGKGKIVFSVLFFFLSFPDSDSLSGSEGLLLGFILLLSCCNTGVM